jgi:hypothetical protein
MVTPKGSMSTEGETLQVSVLPHRCSICPPCCVCLGCCAADFGSSVRTYELPLIWRWFQKIIVAQAFKNLPAFHGMRRFITVYTNKSLPLKHPVRTSNTISPTYILIYSPPATMNALVFQEIRSKRDLRVPQRQWCGIQIFLDVIPESIGMTDVS